MVRRQKSRSRGAREWLRELVNFVPFPHRWKVTPKLGYLLVRVGEAPSEGKHGLFFCLLISTLIYKLCCFIQVLLFSGRVGFSLSTSLEGRVVVFIAK